MAALPPDHWQMIAVGEMAPTLGEGDERAMLVGHCVALARDMLRAQQGLLGRFEPAGGFDPSGRSTPTATRLEGLLALSGVLGGGEAGRSPDAATETFAQELSDGIDAGIRFLCRCQVLEGRGRGGFVRAVRPISTADGFAPAEVSKRNARQAEIRIDYVQHAMCALMRHQRMREGR
jgi:hypothetical protein